MTENCSICGCILHRTANTYATPTVAGRSHATEHHYVAKRFKNVFENCPWGLEGKAAVFCYECHEELLHNPVLLPEDIAKLRELVKLRGYSENEKTNSRSALAGRIQLFQEIIARGLDQVLAERKK